MYVCVCAFSSPALTLVRLIDLSESMPRGGVSQIVLLSQSKDNVRLLGGDKMK